MSAWHPLTTQQMSAIIIMIIAINDFKQYKPALQSDVVRFDLMGRLKEQTLEIDRTRDAW